MPLREAEEYGERFVELTGAKDLASSILWLNAMQPSYRVPFSPAASCSFVTIISFFVLPSR